MNPGFAFFKDLMQDEENVYSLEKLWGLGPIKKESPVQNPQDVVKFDRYKVNTKIYGFIQYSQTSANSHPSTMATFFVPADKNSVH